MDLRRISGVFASFSPISPARSPTVPSSVSAFCTPPCTLIDIVATKRLHPACGADTAPQPPRSRQFNPLLSQAQTSRMNPNTSNLASRWSRYWSGVGPVLTRLYYRGVPAVLRSENVPVFETLLLHSNCPVFSLLIMLDTTDPSRTWTGLLLTGLMSSPSQDPQPFRAKRAAKYTSARRHWGEPLAVKVGSLQGDTRTSSPSKWAHPVGRPASPPT
jgi:hypothetical protein